MMPQRRYDSSIGDSMAGLDEMATVTPPATGYHEPNGYELGKLETISCFT